MKGKGAMRERERGRGRGRERGRERGRGWGWEWKVVVVALAVVGIGARGSEGACVGHGEGLCGPHLPFLVPDFPPPATVEAVLASQDFENLTALAAAVDPICTEAAIHHVCSRAFPRCLPGPPGSSFLLLPSFLFPAVDLAFCFFLLLPPPSSFLLLPPPSSCYRLESTMLQCRSVCERFVEKCSGLLIAQGQEDLIPSSCDQYPTTNCVQFNTTESLPASNISKEDSFLTALTCSHRPTLPHLDFSCPYPMIDNPTNESSQTCVGFCCLPCPPGPFFYPEGQIQRVEYVTLLFLSDQDFNMFHTHKYSDHYDMCGNFFVLRYLHLDYLLVDA